MSTENGSVLFVDDERSAVDSIVRSLKRQGGDFSSLLAHSENEALLLAKQHGVEVAVVDLTLDPSVGPESGFTLINQLLTQDPTIRVLVLTGHGSDEFGIRAMQHGAASYLIKPVESAHLLALIRDALNCSRLKRMYLALQANLETISSAGLSSSSPKMKGVLETVNYATTHKLPVLIAGETGTGKGVIAQAIHRVTFGKNGPFIRFQPSFGSADLVSSELFGHKKGAFTGATEDRRGLLEEANEGTLFIDEVDELPLESQILLLNVLQEKAFRRVGSNQVLRSDFRLISATNRPIEEILRERKLRHDFFYRISHVVLQIPPLRERHEDIPTLAIDILRNIANRENLLVHDFIPRAMERLQQYSWPGNIRELQAKVEGAAHRAHYLKRHFIEAEDLEISVSRKQFNNTYLSFREKIRQYEIQLIHEALAKHPSQTQAAQSLQLDRTTLRRILERADGERSEP